MRASSFSLSLIAAAAAGFSLPPLVDAIERLLGDAQASPVVVNVASAHAVETKKRPPADLPKPRYPLLLAGSVIPQAISETKVPVTELPATKTDQVVAKEKIEELPTQPRADFKAVQTKAGGRAAMTTQMAPIPPRRPRFHGDQFAEGPLPAISQFFESAHRGLERVADSMRVR
jgi:hypothetical protein